jgi:hypothetical protein
MLEPGQGSRLVELWHENSSLVADGFADCIHWRAVVCPI